MIPQAESFGASISPSVNSIQPVDFSLNYNSPGTHMSLIY